MAVHKASCLGGFKLDQGPAGQEVISFPVMDFYTSLIGPLSNTSNLIGVNYKAQRFRIQSLLWGWI